jgi:hypothetical protein
VLGILKVVGQQELGISPKDAAVRVVNYVDATSKLAETALRAVLTGVDIETRTPSADPVTR